jgi:hypothetical protein
VRGPSNRGNHRATFNLTSREPESNTGLTMRGR